MPAKLMGSSMHFTSMQWRPKAYTDAEPNSRVTSTTAACSHTQKFCEMHFSCAILATDLQHHLVTNRATS
jgi:hypothetical protein